MSHTRLLPLSFACALALVAPAAAQDGAPAAPSHAEITTVTTAATADRVRFAAPNTVVQLRLEVYDEAGQKMLDTEQRGGNVLDWHLQSSSGERVADGSYLCVVTVKNLSGRFSQKIGLITVSAQATTLRSAAVSELNLRQAQAVGPVESGDEGLTVMKAEDVQPVTVLANSGDEAQLARTRGALTFRVGDFFSGSDKEQMRLTEEGNLGIGTAKPKVKLDVAGMIRAREGFAFSNGSTLNVSDKGALTLTSSNGSIVPNVTGTGTQNQIAKWTANPGELGDAALYETGGLVFIGQNSSGQLAPLAAVSGQFHTVEVGVPPGGKSPLTLAGGSGVMEFWKDLGGGVGNPAAAVSFGMAVPGTPATNDMLFSSEMPGIGWNERMRLTNAGNLGLGVTTPAAKLDVAGNINTSTQFNIGGNRLLSTAGVKNLYAGVSTGPNSVTAGSCCNAFFGTLTGTANTTGTGNSFFGDEVGSANTTGSDNSFFGLGSGIKNSSGSGNSFFGSQAGVTNTGAGGNSFFGFNAGNKSTGSSNSFFGNLAGEFNTNASQNSFFGAEAGVANTTAINNSFFGYQAGKATNNSAADNNSFFGTFAGISNISGSSNSFFGEGAGSTNTTGTNNSSLGFHAEFTDGLTNTTAIGFRSFVGQSNSLVLGSINGVNGATVDTKVGIGTTAPARHLHVFGAGDQQIGIESSDTGGRQWTLQSSNGTSAGGRFEIVDRTANASRLTILSTGNVGIGTTGPVNRLSVAGTADFSGNVGIGTTTPANRLHVAANILDFDSTPTPAEHVALIENTYIGEGQDVLAIKVGVGSSPIFTDNFITFFNGDDAPVGALEGNNTGVSLVGPGNDYAEWLPRLNSAEKIEPGEIVGLNGGRITKNTRGASQIMAVSTGPIVAGNDPGRQARHGYERVAFVGQVMARVRGTVHAGDFIVASGLNDGTGIAVSPERVTSEQFEQVVGQAWQTSADDGVKSVRIAVGLIRRDPTVRRLLEYSRDQADRIGALDDRLSALEAQLTSKTARTSPRPVTRKQRRLVARLVDVGAPRSVRTTAGTLR